MPRNASQVYAVPVGTDGTPNTIIFSGKYNTFIHDVETDLNTPRPVVAGGTGSTSADGALVNLSGEKAAQVVTNWDSTVWMPGSFYAATTASGAAPVASHAFAGVVVINEPLVSPPTNQNVVVEARDMTDPAHLTYYRIMTAGVWGPWLTARQSIYAAPFDAMAYNGMQVNGSMEVDQPAAGTITLNPSAALNLIDSWKSYNGSTSAVYTVQRSSSIFPAYNSELKLTVTAAQASAGAGSIQLTTPIEGYRFIRNGWNWGPSYAPFVQQVSVGFWVKSSVAGTINLLLYDNVSNSASANVVISSPNVAQYVTATFTCPSAWSGSFTNGIGALFIINLMSPSFNIAATNGNTFEITGVVVLPGIEAPSAARSPLIMRAYDQELVTCKRYWQKLGGSKAADVYIGGYATAGNAPAHTLTYPTEMRALPTGVIVGSWTAVNASALTLSGVGTRATSLTFNVTASGIGAYYTTDTTCFVALDARL